MLVDVVGTTFEYGVCEMRQRYVCMLWIAILCMREWRELQERSKPNGILTVRGWEGNGEMHGPTT